MRINRVGSWGTWVYREGNGELGNNTTHHFLLCRILFISGRIAK